MAYCNDWLDRLKKYGYDATGVTGPPTPKIDMTAMKKAMDVINEAAIIPKELWRKMETYDYSGDTIKMQEYYAKRLYEEEKRRWLETHVADFYDTMKYSDYNKITTRQPTQEDRWMAVIKFAFKQQIKDLPYKLLDVIIEQSQTRFSTIVGLRVQTMCNQMEYRQELAKELEQYKHIPIEKFLIEIVRLAVQAAIDHDAEHINDD